jgi:quinol monooxygenase YgiN
MILITGSVQPRPETLQEMPKISLEHVHRLRLELGSLSHAVSQHAENPCKLVQRLVADKIRL